MALITGAVVAGVAVVALVLWAVLGGLGRGTPTATATTVAPSLNLPGHLVVFDSSSGRLATAAPDGSRFRLLPGPAYPANYATVSPDGQHAVVGGVQVVDIGVAGRERPLLDATGDSTAVPQPWADGGKRLVLMGTGASSMLGGIETVDLDGGSAHKLGGDAGGVAGDPSRDGAVVAVQGGTEVNLGPYTERDTSRVELRWWKDQHQVLATTADLVRATELPKGKPYAVWPLVAPDGQHIVLTVDGLVPNTSAASARHALVIIDRSGTIAATRTSYTSIEPVWTHDSRQVAYLDDGGVTLLQLTGSQVKARTITAQVLGTSCLFSPAGDHLLCDDVQTGDRSIIRLSDDHVDQAHHDPKRVAVAWLSGTAVTPTGSGT
ncbi:MAG: hypothetical protein L0H79_00345 [Intrasporangium sp.]|uniref:hypothetical protein n=1 Tax=Intrasporangium sp. TaxID=1925024 RepID=UPI0026489307|nr:hypothetical protein [Intrasporangium sp.]MDN5794182.1 hypothetical protein [Intrasporangium sp.]